MRAAISFLVSRPWLSSAAVLVLTAASAAVNAWGYLASFKGLLCLVLVAMALSCEVLGVRLAHAVERAWTAGQRFRASVGLVLLAGVVGFNLVSGHRALALADAEADAPRQAALAARAQAEAHLADIRAELAAIPALPENVPAVRLRAYVAARGEALARLNPARAAAEAALASLPTPAQTEKLAAWAYWALAGLIEALKALALWSIRTAAPAALAAAPRRNAGRDLALRRWALARAAAA